MRAIESCTKSRSEVERRSRLAGGRWLEPRNGKTPSGPPSVVDSEAQEKIRALGMEPPKDQVELHEICAAIVRDQEVLCAEYISALNDFRLKSIALRMRRQPNIDSTLKPARAPVQRAQTASARGKSSPVAKERKTVTNYELVTKSAPASPSYAVRPGLIAYATDAYCSYFEVDGYKASRAMGVAVKVEVSRQRASLHLMRLLRLQDQIGSKLTETQRKLDANRQKTTRSFMIEAEEEELAKKEDELEKAMDAVEFGVERHAHESTCSV
eukprot:1124623-Rhodomonas_salina.3